MEQASIVRFEYKGFPISFDFGDGTKLINATEMVKPFNKLLKDFFRLQQTAEYIDVLHKSLKMSRWENSPIGQIRGLSTENLARIYPELIKVVKGGNQPQGTWVHEKIALKFAAWLSPYFELWIYDRIHEKKMGKHIFAIFAGCMNSKNQSIENYAHQIHPFRTEQFICIYFSYDLKDEQIQEQIEKHLSIFSRAGAVSTWHKGKVYAGQPYREIELAEILKADIILLLLSVDYISSDYIWQEEMRLALRRHESGEALVVPVLIRPLPDFSIAPFGNLKALPLNGRALTKWKNLDEGISRVVNDLMSSLEERFLNSNISSTASRRKQWRITLDEPWSNFSEDRLNEIELALWKLTGDPNLRITAKEPGSVRLTVVGSPKSYEIVKEAYDGRWLGEKLSANILNLSEAIGASVRFSTKEIKPGEQPYEIVFHTERMSDLGEFPPLITGFSYPTAKPLPPGFKLGHPSPEVLDEAKVAELTQRLGEYFNTFMVVQGEYLNVDLNPYKDYCGITEPLRKTRLGWDLLRQDFDLKLFVANLLHPRHEIGATFWKEVIRLGKMKEEPVSCFQVWIVPGNVSVHQRQEGEFGHIDITSFDMKVLCQVDYLTAQHLDQKGGAFRDTAPNEMDESYLEAFKQIVLPEIVKEVNQGPMFGLLRQIYTALICAKWYMNQIGDRMPNYIGSNDVEKYGLNVVDENPEQIQLQYKQLFENGAWETVLPWYDRGKSQISMRQFVSGRIDFAPTTSAIQNQHLPPRSVT